MPTDMYMQFTGVQGLIANAVMPGGKKGIPVQNYHLNLKMPLTNQGHGPVPAGRAVFGELSITKYIDETSPQFQFFCANGTRIPAVTVSLVGQSGAGEYHIFLEYKLDTAFISRVNVGSAGAGTKDKDKDKEAREKPSFLARPKSDLPLEVISFSYSKISWTFFPPKNKAGDAAAGKVTNMWDLQQNKGG